MRNIVNEYPLFSPTGKRVAISGGTGFLGLRLQNFLSSLGFQVLLLVRTEPAKPSEVTWDPYKKYIDKEKLEGVDIFIHLSGESIAKRWTRNVKERIVTSRIETTQFLVSAIKTLSRKPTSFLCASGISYCGAHPKKEITEKDEGGDDFLATVCKEWEKAAFQLQKDTSIKVCTMRFGIVTSPHGGIVKTLNPIFKLGLGGPVGCGKRAMSWIALDDVLFAMYHLIAKGISGSVNFVAPEPVTNAEFTKALAASVHRPAIFPVPPMVLKLLYGEMANETILSDIRAKPAVLLDSGFSFEFPDLRTYLALVN